jgi:acyl-CoA thioester hydrolase
MEYRVPYADTDQMGVVYYANYLVYFERVRNEFLRDLGLTYREMESRGWGLPVVQAHVDYRSPAFYDDLLSIRARVTRATALRITIHCEVLRGDTMLATGWTEHIFVDLKTRRPRRVDRETLALVSTRLS